MARTYKAILQGDHVEWIDPPPPNDEATPVQITFPEENEATGKSARRVAMVDALETIAREGGIGSIKDPAAWEREMRTDRSSSVDHGK